MKTCTQLAPASLDRNDDTIKQATYLFNRIQQHRDLNKRPRQIIRSIPHSRHQRNPETSSLSRATETNSNHLLTWQFSDRNSTLHDLW